MLSLHVSFLSYGSVLKVGHFGRTRQGKLICRSAPAETPKALDRGRSQSRGRALTEAPPASEDQASVSSVQLAQ